MSEKAKTITITLEESAQDPENVMVSFKAGHLEISTFEELLTSDSLIAKVGVRLLECLKKLENVGSLKLIKQKQKQSEVDYEDRLQTEVFAVMDDFYVYRLTKDGLVGSSDKLEYIRDADSSIKDFTKSMVKEGSAICRYVDAEDLSDGSLEFLINASQSLDHDMLEDVSESVEWRALRVELEDNYRICY